MPIIHAQLQLVPFHAVFLGFLFTPTRSPIPHLAAVNQQHSQFTATSLRQSFLWQLLIALLSLLFGSRSGSLHQSMQRRVVQILSPLAGHLRRVFIRTGGCHRETELLSETGSNLLVI